MLKFHHIAILLLFIPGMIRGQESTIFSQHMHNPILYNPAFAGDRDIPGLTLFSRQQLMGWEGSPSSNLLLGHTRMKNKNAGLGVGYWYDRMGPVQHSGLSGAYSYTIQLTEESKLRMGLQLEFRVLQIRISQLELVDQGDLLFAEDPGMKFQPNAGFGFCYIYSKYQVSLSVPKVLKPGLTPYQGEHSSLSQTPRLVFLGATSHYRINEDLGVEPSLLTGFGRGHTPYIELAGILQYREKLGFGLIYRYSATLGAMVRYRHEERFEVGYSYDVSMAYTRFNTGTHEIYLGYNFPFNRTKNLSPRRF